MGLEQRKTEQETRTLEERKAQIARMRNSIDNELLRSARDISTNNISKKTQDMIREKLAELPAREPDHDKGRGMER